MLGYLKMRFLLHCNWLGKNYNITCKEKQFKVIQILYVLSLHLVLQLTTLENFIGFFRHHSLQVMLGPFIRPILRGLKNDCWMTAKGVQGLLSQKCSFHSLREKSKSFPHWKPANFCIMQFLLSFCCVCQF